jgi:hypothetical protein
MRYLILLMLSGCTMSEDKVSDKFDLTVDFRSPECSCMINGEEAEAVSGESTDVDPGRMRKL